MKIISTAQISNIDRYTIEHEPISEIDLMERASAKFTEKLIGHYPHLSETWVFCGPGNNGGDGLAIARMLASMGKRPIVKVFLLNFGKELKGTPRINLDRLQELPQVEVKTVSSEHDIPAFDTNVLVIDALFGSGLTRPLTGLSAHVVEAINNSQCQIVAVDIPSGLMGEDNSTNTFNTIIKAERTITFQLPKLSFLLPGSGEFAGDWEIANIGLQPEAIDNEPTNYHFFTLNDARKIVRHRNRFSHKGTYGHALLIAGSYGRMGASILASKACLRSGVGLLTTHVPHGTYHILQTAIPEAMSSIDDSELMFTSIESPNCYSAIGIGPALGQKVNTQRGFRKLLSEVSVPLVVDADALNIIGLFPDLLAALPPLTVLTPHPKEFERIAGPSSNSFERLQQARALSAQYKVIVVLKGAYTSISMPDGCVSFNSSGNPGMATAGSGDVLTGIILSLLAQGYPPQDAAKLGVFVHGLAGDLAASKIGQTASIASDIVDNLGLAFQQLRQ